MADSEGQPRYWMVTTFGSDRDYAGNTGYADDLESVYRYDQNVPNHRQVSVGDLLLLRDQTNLLGIARILRLNQQLGRKNLLRCPTCRTTGIKRRETISPPYRCNNKHEFDRPDEDELELEQFEAEYGGAFRKVDVNVSVLELRNACPRYGAQLAIQELSPELLSPDVGRALGPVFRELLSGAAVKRTVRSAVRDPNPLRRGYLESDEASQEDDGSTWSGDGTDRREVAMREIRRRRGQQNFRAQLLSAYGGRCAITDCTTAHVLEAAHISPYRGGAKDNHPSNGLLLRSDVHTLFDLDLLGIEPGTLTVRIHPSVDEYRELDGREVKVPRAGLSTLALEARWEAFRNRLARTE